MSMAYGYEVQPENDSFLAVVQEVSKIGVSATLPGSLLVNNLPILQHLPRGFPGTGFRKVAQRGRELGESMKKDPIALVKDRMRKGIAPPSIARDSLEVLQDLPEDSKPGEITEQVVRDACGSIYLAGVDTVVSSLLTAFLSLALHPDMQHKAQAELDAVTGRSRAPTFEDRVRLPYVDALCKELVRWRPIGPLGLPHMLQADDMYRGYYIPKGALVMANLWTILRDPEAYPNPEKFAPERFLTDDGLLHDDCDLELAPAFGLGRRVCPGRHLADAIIFMTVASVLSAFDVSKAKDTDGVEIPIPGTYTGEMVSAPEPFRCSITVRA
ncbi:cytochrome P450 [Auriscalpium vulgare]|uniref:Cytochrome P450 n=1 Tax=Auriscalpium vulgare TaxID=40419 RepID=A0ACB8R9D8_9AGAM|nr:cytochrome P450 [Auriscalpium vulgare]